jgi:23S rRNA (guanosine2251-2'-O)-methyltransferase
MSTWVFGHHAVEAVLNSKKRKVHELHLTPQHAKRYERSAKSAKVRITQATPKDLDRKFPEKVHQGVAVLVDDLPKLHIEDVMEEAKLLLILDQVTDARNIGACLRSANAFGVDALIVPSHGSAVLNDVAIKASVGASEHTPVIEVGNLNKTIDILKKEGFWLVGLDGYAEQNIAEIDLKGRIAIVMGSEGSGLRDLVKKNCDFTAKLPMVGEVESLNVSVATGVALYEALKQRQL